MEENERRAEDRALRSVRPVPSCRHREVRGLVVMTVVVMAARLGNKQDEGMAVNPVERCCCGNC